MFQIRAPIDHDTMALLPPPASPCSLSSFIPPPPSLALKSTTSLALPKRRRSLCAASWQEVRSLSPTRFPFPHCDYHFTADVIVPLKSEACGSGGILGGSIHRRESHSQ